MARYSDKLRLIKCNRRSLWQCPTPTHLANEFLIIAVLGVIAGVQLGAAISPWCTLLLGIVPIAVYLASRISDRLIIEVSNDEIVAYDGWWPLRRITRIPAKDLRTLQIRDARSIGLWHSAKIEASLKDGNRFEFGRNYPALELRRVCESILDRLSMVDADVALRDYWLRDSEAFNSPQNAHRLLTTPLPFDSNANILYQRYFTSALIFFAIAGVFASIMFFPQSTAPMHPAIAVSILSIPCTFGIVYLISCIWLWQAIRRDERIVVNPDSCVCGIQENGRQLWCLRANEIAYIRGDLGVLGSETDRINALFFFLKNGRQRRSQVGRDKDALVELASILSAEISL